MAAIRVYSHAIEAQRSGVGVGSALGTLHGNRGAAALMQQQHQAAARDCREALELGAANASKLRLRLCSALLPCGKLDEARLLRVWAGDYAIEQALHAALLSDHGEFYPAERAREITAFLDNVVEPLELPLVLGEGAPPLVLRLPTVGTSLANFDATPSPHKKYKHKRRSQEANCNPPQ